MSESATNRDPSGDTPLYCTKCKKNVQHQGHCPKGGNHHLISISDKGVQGQGHDDGPESKRNKQQPDPHKIGAKVASTQDRIRLYAMQYLAHDSGDGQTVYHCPFCGGGNVIGRSDGTIECGFCNTHFTVQVQPEFAGMPQTIDGQPYDVPGMPGGVDPLTGQPPEMEDGMEDEEDGEMPPEGPPGDADMGSPEDEEAQGKNGSSVPWEHQSKRYASLAGTMTEDQYMAHLALVHTARYDDADYTFDVDYADDKDALKRGEVVSGTHRVTVRSHSKTDAEVTAHQMLFARGKEPTAARLVDVRV